MFSLVPKSTSWVVETGGKGLKTVELPIDPLFRRPKCHFRGQAYTLSKNPEILQAVVSKHFGPKFRESPQKTHF